MASEKLPDNVIDASRKAFRSWAGEERKDLEVLDAWAEAFRSGYEAARNIALVDAGADKAGMYADFAEKYKSSISSDDDAGEVRGDIRRTISGWQDIETAPRDGTGVLLWVGDRARVGDYRNGWMAGMLATYATEPTHWMPLPAAPGQPQGETVPDGCIGVFGYAIPVIGSEAWAKSFYGPDYVPQGAGYVSSDQPQGETHQLLDEKHQLKAPPDTIPVPADVWKQMVGALEFYSDFKGVDKEAAVEALAAAKSAGVGS